MSEASSQDKIHFRPPEQVPLETPEEIHFQPPEPPAAKPAERRFSYDARDPGSQREEARRYRRRVAAVRRFLPLAAVVLCITVLFAPQLQPLRDIFTSQSSLLDAADDGVALVGARFRGSDSNDQPYRLTAEQVHERPEENDRYDLVNPQGDITMSDGAWLTLGAAGGLYDRAVEHLSLEGAVSLFHDQGYELHTEAAEIDLAANRAWGDAPVSGQAGFGEIVAEGFRLEDGGARIVFTGQAELTLYPDAEGFPQ